jgi:hypothetical protein
MRTRRRHEASKRVRPDRSGSSYAGMNRIKFAGLDHHLSTLNVHPGQGGVYAIHIAAARSADCSGTRWENRRDFDRLLRFMLKGHGRNCLAIHGFQRL